MSQSTGPACGNNPNYRMSDGDRQAVEAFKAYLAERAALRDRIAEILRPHASIGGVPPRYELPFFDGATPSLPRISGWRPLDDVADAVLAVLPEPADRAEWDALCRDADRLRKDGAQLRARADHIDAMVQQLRADRAAVLREAADRIDREDLPQDEVDMFDNGARWATKLLRRMADEAQP